MELYFVLYGRTEDLEGIDSHTRHASRAMTTRDQAERYAASIAEDRYPIVVEFPEDPHTFGLIHTAFEDLS